VLLAAVVWLTASLYLRQRAGFAIEEVRLLAFGVLVASAVRALDTHVPRVPVASSAFRSGYSLYAFHAPVLVLFVALGLAWPLVGLGAVLVGWAAFRVLEQPTTRYGRDLAKRRILSPAPDISDVKRGHVRVDT
jgi:peptidoglycan/LPS O-acetylase OafA/YrhL